MVIDFEIDEWKLILKGIKRLKNRLVKQIMDKESKLRYMKCLHIEEKIKEFAILDNKEKEIE